MATVYLTGDAIQTAGVYTIVVSAYDAATTYSVTINGKSVSVVGQGGTVATTATALQVALAASAIPEFTEITWTVNSATITGTSQYTTGRTHTITTSESGGTGTIDDPATGTSPTGPNALVASNTKDASSAARALPGNGDTFVMESLEVDLKYALSALAAVTTLVVDVKASMTGEVGLPFTNQDESTDYSEYRPRYFVTAGGTVTIGQGEGDGTPRFMHDAGSAQATWLVEKTDSSADDDHKAVVLKGTHASNAARVRSGEVDFAPFAGESSTLLTLTCGGDADVRTSKGVVLGTVNVDDEATLEITSAAALADITAINITGEAVCTIYGDNPVTACTMNGSSPTLNLNSSGTFTTLNAYGGAVIDLEGNLHGVTITTLNVYGPITINDPNNKLTITNAVDRWIGLVTYNGNPKRAVTLGSP